MKIAVISDLHIGSNDTTHQLGHTDQAFAKFLFKLEQNFDKIILLGDIYEVAMALVEDDRAEFTAAKDNHYIITQRFDKDKYLYVFGNHDLVGGEFGGLERFVLEYKGIKYLFFHGHQCDPAHKDINRQINFWGSFLLRINKRLYKWITEHVEISTYYSAREEVDKFERSVIKYAKSDYDVVVTGHSHSAKVYTKDSLIYINSGTCTYGRFSYVSMDLDTKEYKIEEA